MIFLRVLERPACNVYRYCTCVFEYLQLQRATVDNIKRYCFCVIILVYVHIFGLIVAVIIIIMFLLPSFSRFNQLLIFAGLLWWDGVGAMNSVLNRQIASRQTIKVLNIFFAFLDTLCERRRKYFKLKVLSTAKCIHNRTISSGAEKLFLFTESGSGAIKELFSCRLTP